jgi:type VI secretion system protein ImpC
MAKKDDASFSFTSKKKPQAAAPVEETPAEAEDLTDTSEAPADPFASSETPTEEAPADPFASPDAPTDPFATPETPPEELAAETPSETPMEEPPAEEAPAKPTGPRIREHKQFRILVMADFSGRANRQLLETGDAVAHRKTHTIDADSFDRVVTKVKPMIQLPVSTTAAVTLEFSAMEDFRPDALLARIEAFQGLLKIRADLQNPKTFKTAAAAVRKMTGEKKPHTAKSPAKGAEREVGAGSDFERLMSQPIAPKNAETANVDALIANLVAGYEVPDADPDQARMVKLVEDALAAGLRAVLRHPAFQTIESAWRGVDFLTSRLNTDADLKICLFDISKDELYADMNAKPLIAQTGIYQVVVEQTKVPGVEPFALIVGNYAFDQNPRDIGLLAKLASLGHEAGIPFLAAGMAKIAGFPSFGKFPDSGKWQPPADLPMWEKIRGHKAAAHLGLVAPRFLLRLPYGPKTDAIDTFAFEEMPGNTGGPGVEGYLWGNGAFAVALGMGEGFLEDGWSFEPVTDVTDLPCHMAMVDGDKEMMPCAEGWLSDRIGEVLHGLGLIPLLSVRNAASVKIAGVHSIAKGGKPLAAGWANR